MNDLHLGLRISSPLGHRQRVDGEEEGHQARQGNGQVDEDEEDAYGLAGEGSEDGLQVRVAKAEDHGEGPQEGNGAPHEDDPVAELTPFPSPSDTEDEKDHQQDKECGGRSDAEARVLLGGLAARNLFRGVKKQQEHRQSAEEGDALRRQPPLPH